jgi:hypothetical protein
LVDIRPPPHADTGGLFGAVDDRGWRWRGRVVAHPVVHGLSSQAERSGDVTGSDEQWQLIHNG